MNSSDVMRHLAAAGVTLRIEGATLRYRAPPGAIMPDLRDALRELKPTLLYEYHERAGILEYAANLPRPEAEAKAAEMVLNHNPMPEIRPPTKGNT
jgi:hypothetical protein